MTSARHIIVESYDHYELARGAGIRSGVTWYTTSPLVIERLSRDGEAVRTLDRMLAAGTEDRIGHVSIDVARELASKIAPMSNELNWPTLPALAQMQMHRLLSALLYKQVILNQWLKETAGERVVVGSTEYAPGAGANMGVGLYDTLYAVLAARMHVEGMSVMEAATADIAELLAEIDKPTMLTRLISYTNISPHQLLFRIWRLLGRRRIPGFGRPTRSCLLLNDNNEAIREALPWLVRGGFALERLTLPAVNTEVKAPAMVVESSEVARAIAEAAAARNINGDWSGVAEIVAAQLTRSSCYWQATMAVARAFASRQHSRNPASVVLTSTPKGYTAYAFATCAKQIGIPVAVTEHGFSAGLSRYHEPLAGITEAISGTHYLVCSEGANAFFAEPVKRNSISLNVIGLAEETRRVLNAPWQRFLVRRTLLCRRDDRLVMFVTGTVQNNLRLIPFTPPDFETYALQRTMADDVMPRLRGVPVMKLYATRRYLDADPLQKEFTAPAPVRTLKFGDFRFLRAAADIIILDSPLSTLGWALGAGKPIVYLHQQALPLIASARDALERAVFFVDTHEPDWQERLVASLNRPEEEVASEWQAKAPAREAFIEHYVFGPEGAGRRSAKLLASLVEQADAGSTIGADKKVPLA